MTKKKNDLPADLDPNGLTDFEDDQVILQRDGFGRASLLPASLRGLSPDAAQDVREMMELADQIVSSQSLLEHFVAQARSNGVPWSGIGWATGMTGEGARVRWRDAESRHP